MARPEVGQGRSPRASICLMRGEGYVILQVIASGFDPASPLQVTMLDARGQALIALRVVADGGGGITLGRISWREPAGAKRYRLRVTGRWRGEPAAAEGSCLLPAPSG